MTLQNALTVLESQLCIYSKEEVSDASLPQIDWIYSDKSVKCVCLEKVVFKKCDSTAESNSLFENCKCLYRENKELRSGAAVDSEPLQKGIRPLYEQELCLVIFLICVSIWVNA